jgi:hypothetical protein
LLSARIDPANASAEADPGQPLADVWLHERA